MGCMLEVAGASARAKSGGVLKQEDKLLPIGRVVSWLLNKIDKHHVEDAVKNKS